MCVCVDGKAAVQVSASEYWPVFVQLFSLKKQTSESLAAHLQQFGALTVCILNYMQRYTDQA